MIGDDMKKTKIICSIGPSCSNSKTLSELAIHGMDVARINFSHGDYEEKDRIVENILEARKLSGKEFGILWDTRGPEFRTGVVSDDRVILASGSTIKIIKKSVVGDQTKICVNHPEALKRIPVGSKIYIDDARMELKVLSHEKDGISCEVVSGGILFNNKSVTVPGINLGLPYVSKQDKKDIEYACRNDGEFIALSFVNSKDDVFDIRKVLKEYNREDLKIICKIESRLGVENIDEIIDVSDGVMVARGDLGAEIPSERLPIIQKQIIKKARNKGKICIVATEMLESMVDETRPKRSETSDVANAVLDGVDAVMLSVETAVGKFPVEACNAMKKICEVTEAHATFDYTDSEIITSDESFATSIAVVDASNRLNAKLICATTVSGLTPSIISNLKPNAVILALCPNDKVRRRLSLNWGVYTKITPFYNSTDEVLKENIKLAREFMELKKDDFVVVTGSYPSSGESHPTNLMKIEKIK